MERKRVIKIGLLAITSILALILGSNYLKGIYLFDKDKVYMAVYDKIDGLVVASPVLINGFRVGQVRDISFLQGASGRILVKLAIEDQYQLPKGTSAFIYSTDIMGTKGVKLLMSSNTEYHSPKDTLLTGIEGDLKDQVSMQMLPLKNKAESLMLQVDSVLAVVRYIFDENTRANLASSFASIKNTIANLESTTYTFDTLVTTEKRKLASIISNVESITANLKNNNEPLTKAIKNFSDISDSLAKSDLKNTITNANAALVSFNDLMTKATKGDGTISQLLNNDTLYTNIENATYNLNRLLRDMRENPKRYVHFSAFDFGRTIYIEDSDSKKAKKYIEEEEDKKTDK